MKRLRSASFLALCGLLIWLLADSTALRDAAMEALGLCARSVIPALSETMDCHHKPRSA